MRVFLPYAYPVIALQEDLLGLMPVTKLLRRGEVGAMVSVQICEDPVLILQIAMDTLRCAFLNCGKTSSGRCLG